MVKSWLTQILRRLREVAPKECRAVDFPIGVEVTGRDASRWVVSLADGRVDTRARQEVKLKLLVPQSRLRLLAMKQSYRVWKEAFETGGVTLETEDEKLLEKLRPLVLAAGRGT